MNPDYDQPSQEPKSPGMDEYGHEPVRDAGAPVPQSPVSAWPEPASVQPAQPAMPEYYQPPAPQPTIQPPVPVAAPVQPKEPVNAGLIILQWLTYAFWGWTVLALSVLTATVLASFIGDADTGGFTPYGIAAVLVLLPISFICDYFYSKREPIKKEGAETLVMVIHAVLFALFGIGSLIFTVFAIVQLLTSSNDSQSTQVGLYSSLIITVYYAMTFLRTLNPSKLSWVKRAYKMVMLVSIAIIVLLGILGPVAKERSLRDDKLIESNLSNIEQAISSYARTNDKLPADLKALDLKGDSKKLIDSNLVTYKPQTGTVTTYENTGASAISRYQSDPVYRYQLCVTFKKESRNYGDYGGYSRNADKDTYTSYVSTYDHPAGESCYKLETTGY